MAKQRRESIEMFDKGGRDELAAIERSELAVIEEFLPRQMDEAETKAAIEAIKGELGASSFEGHGQGHGGAEGTSRHGARHGPRERLGEGRAAVRLHAALPLLLLAACSKGPEASSATSSTAATPEVAPTPDKPHTLVPADFASLTLGAKVVGSNAKGRFVSDGQTLAEVSSYVACSDGVTNCDPSSLPGGTVYTYVHVVTPGRA